MTAMKIPGFFFPLLVLQIVALFDVSLLVNVRDEESEALKSTKVAAALDTVEKTVAKVDDPDINRNVLEIIRSKGYPVENHVVQTPDGYILTIQRIPYGLKPPGSQKGVKKDAVLFLHALLVASDSFVPFMPNESLGYIVADAGYDVWLGNFRGGPYALWHVNYTRYDQEFYDFSIDSLAYGDIPTMIDYVLKATGSEKLFLICESLGTTAAFAALASLPRYNNKVELLLALSPVAYCTNMLYTSRLVSLLMNEFDKIEGPLRLIPRSEFGNLITQVVCNNKFQAFSCSPGLSIFGARPYYLNESKLPLIINHFPAESSTRILAHFGQLIKSDRFCKFDYGLQENRIRYKQDDPPSYNLGAITAPVALLWAQSDTLATPEDLNRTRKELRSVREDYRVPDEHFNHLDFAIGYKAPYLVHPEILKMLQRAVQRRHQQKS